MIHQIISQLELFFEFIMILMSISTQWDWEPSFCNILIPVHTNTLFVGLFDRVYRYFQQYFSYIVTASGGNRSTRRKSPTCRRSRTNFIIYCCTPRPGRDSSSVVIGTDCKGNPTTIRSRPRRPHYINTLIT